MASPVDSTDNSSQLICLQQELSNLRHKHANVLNQLSFCLESMASQSLEIQTLKDEIARLKSTSPRPKLPRGNLEGPGGGNDKNAKGASNPGRGKDPRQKKTGLSFTLLNV